MGSRDNTRIYIGTFVQVSRLGGGLEICHNHVLVTDDRGHIQHFARRADAPTTPDIANLLSNTEKSNIVEAPKGSFFLPTFCDLHLHAPQFLYLGTGLHLPLMQWLDAYAYRAEERLDADPTGLAKRVYSRLAARLIEAGTGAALLFGTINEDTK